MEKELKEQYRFFLKDSIRKITDFTKTDQSKGIEAPPIEKPYTDDNLRIDLVKSEDWKGIRAVNLVNAIAGRKSRRDYNKTPLSLDELSFLLWAVQGIKGEPFKQHAFRTVPSAGCRHALETYLAVFHVDGLEQGIYRYLPLSHQLILEFSVENLQEKIIKATFGQSFSCRSAVVFIWTAIPYRMEWRYGTASYKVIAIDAGHVCQNLYLACEAIGAGTCAIAAYDQEFSDTLIKVDGVEEFVVYMAPVGKV